MSMVTNLEWIRYEYRWEAVAVYGNYRLEVAPKTYPSNRVSWEVIDTISDTVVAEGVISCGIRKIDSAKRFEQCRAEIELAKQQAELKCDELTFDKKFITW